MTMNIFFISIPEGIDAQRDSEPFKIIQLPVGDLGCNRLFLVKSRRLFEVTKVNQTSTSTEASWFVGDWVKQDGSLYVASYYNPMYLLLPVLERNAKSFRPLDQIIEEYSQENTGLLLELVDLVPRLTELCETKNIQSEDIRNIFVRLDREKYLKWVVQRVRMVGRQLHDTAKDNQAQNTNSGSFTATSIRKPQSDTIEAKDCNILTDRIPVSYLQTAAEILSDYFPSSIITKASVELGITMESKNTTPQPTESSDIESVPIPEEMDDLSFYNDLLRGKKRGTDSESSPSPPSKSNTLTPQQKKLAATNTKGMKSISSFFKTK